MTNRTLSEVLSIAASGLGKWWPNPWWPKGVSSYNDCAAFVSWALYGLDDDKPRYTYVPHIMDRAIREGRWHGGKALTKRPTDRRYANGIQPGDIVIFDWRFKGSRDHVGIALSAPKNGGVRIRQANNGGGGTGRKDVRDPAVDITYATQFVLGYYRPAYPTKSAKPASSTTAPLTPTTTFQEEDMIHLSNRATTGEHPGWQGTIGLKYARHFTDKNKAKQSEKRHRVIVVNGDEELGNVFNEFGISRSLIPRGGKDIYIGAGASAKDVNAAAADIVKAVTASIAESIPTVDADELAHAVEVALQGGIVEQVEAGVTNVLKGGVA